MIFFSERVPSGRRLILALLFVLALASMGCGNGQVGGQVKQQDRVVVYGTVSLLCSDGLLRHGIIQEDGSYSIPDVPPGPVKVAVESNDPEDDYKSKLKYQDSPAAAAALWRPSPELRKQWFPISSSYKVPETSGLEFEVKRGKNQHDIILVHPPDPPTPRVPTGPVNLPDGTVNEK